MKVGIVGYGNIGQALHQKYLTPEYNFGVSYNDSASAYDSNPAKNCRPIDDPSLKDVDVIVCGAPASQTKYWIDYAVEHKKHFIGFTEDVDVTKYAESVARSDRAMIPQCGIAPGIVNIIADSYARAFSDIYEIKIRVGALPRSTMDELRYAFTWSPEGVINEYKKDCEVILEGTRKTLPGTTGYEKLILDGFEYEAFLTSGGIGSLCETYEGRAQTVTYKTVRYVGHRDAIQHFSQTLSKCPVLINNDDVVVFHVSVTGRHAGDGTLKQLSCTKKVYGDMNFSGIQKTTARGAMLWIDALKRNALVGYIKQEQYNDFAGAKRAELLFE